MKSGIHRFDVLKEWLPIGAIATTTVFAFLYPYLNAYYGEIGLRVTDTGVNPFDLFWRFTMAATYYSRGLPLVMPVVVLALRAVESDRLRRALAAIAVLVFLPTVYLLTDFAPRIFYACLVSTVLAAALFIAHERKTPLRRPLNHLPMAWLALATVIAWVVVTVLSNHYGRAHAQAYLTAPAAEDPRRTLLERLAGVSTGRVLQSATATVDSAAGEVDGALVRRFAVIEGQLILVDLRDCTIRRVPVSSVALADTDFDRLPPQQQRQYSADGCIFPDALVEP